MNECVTYINLSGGVDSTYYLWRYLRENPHEKVLVHHCLLNEARKEVEKKAADNIVNYILKSGIYNFDYTESRFTRKGIEGSILDIEVIGFLSGLILKNRKYKNIKKILLSYCFEETPIIRSHFAQGLELRELDKKHRTKRAITLLETAARKEFEYHIPYINKTKQEMIAEMPKELFAMTWYCRSPINNNPCNKCFNCKRVQKPK